MEVNRLTSFTCIILTIILCSFIGTSNAGLTYDFNLNDIVMAPYTNSSFFRINYFPDVVPAKYVHFPYPENLQYIIDIAKGKYVLNADNGYTLNTQVNNPTEWTPNFVLRQTDDRLARLFVIPEGKTLTYAGMINDTLNLRPHYITYLVKGTLILDPNVNTKFMVGRLIIYPTGTFISKPNPGVNHTIELYGGPVSGQQTYYVDPFRVCSFCCLGCNLTLQGDNSSAAWWGIHGDLNSHLGAPLMEGTQARGFTNFSTTQRTWSGSYDAGNPSSLINDTTGWIGLDGKYHCVKSFVDGHNIIYRQKKNLFITSTMNDSVLITGPANVFIDSVVFSSLGTTQNGMPYTNTYFQPVGGVPYDGYYYGYNPDSIYGLTLLHVTKPVKVNNCIFESADNPASQFLLGAIRSFGEITNNAFLVTNFKSSGLGFIYGTEQFLVQGNGFVATNLNIDVMNNGAGILNAGPFPNISLSFTALYTASPYLTGVAYNSFEGSWSGGVIFEPIQNRASKSGVSVDALLGAYDGQSQNSADSYQSNSVWQSFFDSQLFHNYYFTVAQPRLLYFDSQPDLQFIMRNSYMIRPLTLDNNQIFSAHLLQDSSISAGSIDYNETYGSFQYACTSGTFKSVSFTNIQNGGGQYCYYQLKTTALSIEDSHVPISMEQFLPWRFWDLLSNDTRIFRNVKAERYYSNRYFNPINAWSPVDVALTTTSVPFSVTVNDTYAYFSSVFVNDQLTSNTTYGSQGVPAYTLNSTIPLPSYPGHHAIQVSNNALDFEVNPAYHGNNIFHTYTTDVNKTFYLGIDLSPNVVAPGGRRLGINGPQGNVWTKCQYITECSVSGGAYGQFQTTPTTMSQPSGASTSVASVISILSDYYTTVNRGVASATVSLLPGYYTVFLYFSNPEAATSAYTRGLLNFQFKINGKLDLPLLNKKANYQNYMITRGFLFNNLNSGSTKQNMTIEWGFTGTDVALAGIEIHSNLGVTFPIPIDPPTTSTTTQGSTTSTTTATTTQTSTTTSATNTTTTGHTTTNSTTTSTTGSATTTTSSTTTTTTGKPTSGKPTTGKPSSSSTLSPSILVLVLTFISILFHFSS